MCYSVDSKRVGAVCKRFRKETLQRSVRDVAEALGYCPGVVYQFEAGNNRNYVILLWYLSQGLKPNWIFEEVE